MAHGIIRSTKHLTAGHGIQHGGLLLGGGTWTVDIASGKPFPANAAEWSAFITAKGLNVAVPDSAWGFQEASGNVLDLIGTRNLTVAGTGGTYRTAVPGFTRVGIATSNAATFNLTSTDVTLPNLSTTSMTLLVIALATANPSATRGIAHIGVTTVAQFQISTTSVPIGADGANAVSPAFAVSGLNVMRPYAITHKPTAATLARFATDAEKTTAAFSASVTGQGLRIFGTTSTSADPMTVVAAYAWFGTNGEIVDNDLRSLLTALGYTPAW